MFKKKILIQYILITLSVTSATYNIATWDTIITNTMEPNISRAHIPINVWYPNTTNNDSKFPLLIFGHCFLGKTRYYDYVWQAVVPNGYIVIIPRRFDDTKDENPMARDLSYTFDWILDN
eukprot:447295_1